MIHIMQGRRDARSLREERPLCFVIPNEVRNHYARDCVRNPVIVPPTVIPRCAPLKIEARQLEQLQDERDSRGAPIGAQLSSQPSAAHAHRSSCLLIPGMTHDD
jgi:hypothetical protein